MFFYWANLIWWFNVGGFGTDSWLDVYPAVEACH